MNLSWAPEGPGPAKLCRDLGWVGLGFLGLCWSGFEGMWLV